MVLTFHVPILLCFVERSVLSPATSVILRLSRHGVIGPRDEDPSSSRKVFSVDSVVNVSVAINCFYEVGMSHAQPSSLFHPGSVPATAELLVITTNLKTLLINIKITRLTLIQIIYPN